MEIFSALTFVRGIHWSPLGSTTKANDRERLGFLWCAPELTIEKTVEMLVIRDAMMLIVMSR